MSPSLPRSRTILAALSCLLLLGGCGGRATVHRGFVPQAAPPPEAALRGLFPGASALLEEMEVAPGPGLWRQGDAVLLGLSFDHGSDRTDRLLLVELLERPGERPVYRRRVGVYGEEILIRSPTRATVLRVYDADGELISDGLGQFVELFLDYGPGEVARIGGGYAISTGASGEPAENPRPENDLEVLRPGVYGMMSLLAFGEGAADNSTLAKLIARAFTMGQRFGMLLSMGRFEIRIGDSERLPDEARPIPVLGSAELYRSEITVSVNGKEALRGRAILAPCHAPLGLCGGILWGDLGNVSNPGIRARMVLLGAVRGSEDTNRPETSATPAL